MHRNRLDHDTKEYLNEFYRILDEMIKGMTSAKLTDSISHNFIVQMIPHHRAAIEMSRNILRFTDNEQLREIASNIIEEQTKSIENMEKALDKCSMLRSSTHDLLLYQRRVWQIMRVMFARMRNARVTNRVNCNFMWEMIPHHMGAIEMSHNALRYQICPELKPILDAIITSQQRGVMQMQRLLRQLKCR